MTEKRPAPTRWQTLLPYPWRRQGAAVQATHAAHIKETFSRAPAQADAPQLKAGQALS